MLAPERPFELHGTHALLCLAEQQDCQKPARERQMGVMEDRPGERRELITTFATCKLLTGFYPPDVKIRTAKAFDAIWPAEPGKNLPAGIIGGVILSQFKECHGRTSKKKT